ncbi:lipocalin-like domain-containing protein [Bradyrhizobium sp. LHD-71]|uniref:lipocalin-like domain-containing protein n=1 Tax=Bradyrhizobium sp. LHD-71 TaxID=3072141 RepID=UPI00280E699B|nr:lipocalin-like domain-containing protein [Bradyrhizobium sp. LHD-71]MDQ8731843.1 lipocalin-like domain-containing protein [Bradyrhizobium sp. LHD-71]
MNVRWFTEIISKAAIVALLAMQTTLSHAQGFAGLGEDVDGFAQVMPGKPLRFPADHGAHPDYRIEWWYFTANLKDAEGTSYGVQWTLFRQANKPNDNASGWASRQLWMGHAAVTSAATHHFAERFARGGVGQAGVEAAPFKAWIDNWQMRTLFADPSVFASLQVSASAKDFSYSLRLDGDRQLVLQGDAGYSKKSEQGHASYYYSQPYLRVTGSLVLDRKTIAVTGQGWIDREWSSQPLKADQTGWDWFSLHLASGDKLMLFRLRHADGKHFFAGNWISRDGRSEQLAPGAISMTPTATTRIADRDVPTGWRISIPSRGLEITTAPLNPRSWMDTRFKYWEGPVHVTGSHAGEGYLEMTGY